MNETAKKICDECIERSKQLESIRLYGQSPKTRILIYMIEGALISAGQWSEEVKNEILIIAKTREKT